MKVSEIFRSVQGEGINAGRDAVFLRMALCNLACEWCDTKYTWDWKNYDYKKEVIEMTLEQVKAEISRHEVRHLVLTGGEPMLQERDLAPLLAGLKTDGYYIEIETNGTVVPSGPMMRLVDQWNVSPKLATSGNSVRRENPDAYRFFCVLENAIFKFVITSSEDLSEVEEVAGRYQISRNRIMLMPEARTKEELNEKSAWLEDFCARTNFLFTTRLHIELWGHERGV